PTQAFSLFRTLAQRHLLQLLRPFSESSQVNLFGYVCRDPSNTFRIPLLTNFFAAGLALFKTRIIKCNIFQDFQAT
ncbi:hypothetical protein C0J52_21050, partial [Blattella germanica]